MCRVSATRCLSTSLLDTWLAPKWAPLLMGENREKPLEARKAVSFTPAKPPPAQALAINTAPSPPIWKGSSAGKPFNISASPLLPPSLVAFLSLRFFTGGVDCS